LNDHRLAAEKLAEIAQLSLAEAVRKVGQTTEYAVQQLVVQRLKAAGLVSQDPPIVAFGPNAANPHYEPSEKRPAVLAPDQVVLLDLWGGVKLDTVFADQTWMG